MTARTALACGTSHGSQGSLHSSHAFSKPRRSSESDLSELQYYSAASSINSTAPNQSPFNFKQYLDAHVQTDGSPCCCSNAPPKIQVNSSPDWRVNNIPPGSGSSVNDELYTSGTTPRFYISTSDESGGYQSSPDFNPTSTPDYIYAQVGNTLLLLKDQDVRIIKVLEVRIFKNCVLVALFTWLLFFCKMISHMRFL